MPRRTGGNSSGMPLESPREQPAASAASAKAKSARRIMGRIFGSRRGTVKGAILAPMQIDIRQTSPGKAYRMMISAIVPRPIAFISTLSASGQRSLAPFSFFRGVSSVPPPLAISVFHRQGAPKDTAAHILETGEFVVNTATEELAQKVALASGDYARTYDEFQLTGLTP